MESFTNFLVNNYIWFLVVALVLIFALIGYLVDTKENKKETKENAKKKGLVALPEKPLMEVKPEIKEEPIVSVQDTSVTDPGATTQNMTAEELGNKPSVEVTIDAFDKETTSDSMPGTIPEIGPVMEAEQELPAQAKEAEILPVIEPTPEKPLVPEIEPSTVTAQPEIVEPQPQQQPAAKPETEILDNVVINP